VAKVKVTMPEDLMEKITRLGNQTDAVIGRALEAGGKVALDAVKDNLSGVIGRGATAPSRSTGELVSALGLSPVKVDRNGDYNVKVGFREPRRGGKPCMNHYSCVGMFSSRIKCGDCGSWYGPKVWHSNSKYRRTVYQCNRKCKGAAKCKTPHLYEEDIKRLFVSAMNKLLTDRKEIIANFKEIRETLFDTTALETERSELQSELTVVAELIQKCIDENAHVALNQTEYQERYNGLAVRFDTAKTRLEEVSEMVSSKKMRGERVDAFIAELVRQDGLLTEFDERLWFSLVDFATVYSENNVRFTFKDGTEIMA